MNDTFPFLSRSSRPIDLYPEHAPELPAATSTQQAFESLQELFHLMRGATPLTQRSLSYGIWNTINLSFGFR